MKKKIKPAPAPLALPAPVSGAAVSAATLPPVKQADLLEALVARARQQHREAAAAANAKREAAEDAYAEAFLAAYAADPGLFSTSVDCRGAVELTMIAETPAIAKLRKACVVCGPGYFDEVEVRREIKAGLDGKAARVAAMLADQHVVSLLDDTLTALRAATKKLTA